MRKKWGIGLLSLMIAATPVVGLFAADQNVTLTYKSTQTNASSNTIGGSLKLTNTTRQKVNLEDLKIRYYYTKDMDLTQNVWCDNAGLSSSSGYKTVTSYVKGNFVTMSTPTEDADTYLEISFAEGAGEIPANGTVEIQLRLTNANWQNFNQANDYSFTTETSYSEWEKVTLYQNDMLIQGVEPGAENQVNSEVSATALTFDKNEEVTNSCKTQITLNGNTLDKIYYDGNTLDRGDYTLDANGTLSFEPAFLQTLSVGEHKMVLDFSSGQDVALTIDVVDTTDYDFAVKMQSVSAKKGEEVEIPFVIKNIPAAINNADFTLAYDDEAIEIVSVEAGDAVPNAAGFMSNVLEDKAQIKVLFADPNQDGKGAMSKDGKLMVVKAVALKDFDKAPISLKEVGSFADSNLDELNIAFK